ncbi:MAG: ferritin-like domain-containing protein [Gammaproteobacteria bacterium]|nr:ferritin-like domain-containing protein [Gammaproteobacteria bacterium]
MNAALDTRTLACLQCGDADTKVSATLALRADWLAGRITLHDTIPAQDLPAPGRPALPQLVPPQQVPKHSIRTQAGHAALLHALTHIEFNAINLALDAVYRFRNMPREYYSDWLQVAAEEAHHFGLLRDHLRTLGYDYGAFDAHDGLWQMAVKTAHDPLVRMALVPRLLEARGLDASPAIAEKLRRRGDLRGVDILEIILRDEIGHVRIGNHWYEHFCAERGLDPAGTFQRLLDEYHAPRPRPPLNTKARSAAGFSDEELRYLETGNS